MGHRRRDKYQASVAIKKCSVLGYKEMFFFDHVSKSYGSNPVLVDTTLGIEKGQLVIISGSNGSGKTTLLKIAATLLSPDSGSIYMIKDLSLIHI